MASHGIRDKVAIVGMGCTPFGEHWDKSAEDLLVDAATEAFTTSGIKKEDVDAYWLGTMGSGISGLTLSRPLKIDYKPVTRLENMCATGSEAFRNAAYAVAAGAIDVAMAIGVEKLKDSGFSGLTGSAPPNDGTLPTMTAPASFSLLAPAYAKKYGVDDDEMKDVLTRIAWKNHKNGALNPRAQFKKEVAKEVICNSPLVAGPLGIFDCSGVSDGSAAALIVRAEDAHKYCENPIYVKALSFVAGPAAGPIDPTYDYTSFIEVVRSAADAYKQAGIENPRAELAMAEVHDCFTPTELVLMVERGEGGSVVVTSSVSTVMGAPRNQAYASAKGGIIAMMKGLAVEYARDGIRANAILPGWIETPMTEGAFSWDRFVEKVMPRVPMRRWGAGADFGGIAAYLASDASTYHTGDVLVVDGGYAIF